MRAARSGVGSICLGVFLLVQAMAAMPAFHAWLHPDAAAPAHECAVALLLHGQVHGATTEITPAPCRPLLLACSAARIVDFVSADVALLPGRGPPA